MSGLTLKNSGVVDDCYPYFFGDGKCVPHCSYATCSDNNSNNVKQRVLYGSAKPLVCLAQIKQELESNAPIQTVFIVYKDFMYYKHHIYENTSVKNLVDKLSRSLG